MNTAKALQVMRPLYQWKAVRWQKCLALYELARLVELPIVELGSYDGNGTIALALGAKAGNNAPVYGVDQYKRSSGIYHQEFYASDEQDLHRNAENCGVEIVTIKADARQAALDWNNGPVSLVIWDISLPDRMPGDWEAWRDLIDPGGLFVMKDNHSWDLGFGSLLNLAKKKGWGVGIWNGKACLWGLQKP